MILDYLDLSQLVPASKYYKSIISTFNVTQTTTQGQLKMLYKKHLIILILIIHGYVAYWEHFQTYVFPLFLAMTKYYGCHHCSQYCFANIFAKK